MKSHKGPDRGFLRGFPSDCKTVADERTGLPFDTIRILGLHRQIRRTQCLTLAVHVCITELYSPEKSAEFLLRHIRPNRNDEFQRVLIPVAVIRLFSLDFVGCGVILYFYGIKSIAHPVFDAFNDCDITHFFGSVVRRKSMKNSLLDAKFYFSLFIGRL